MQAISSIFRPFLLRAAEYFNSPTFLLFSAVKFEQIVQNEKIQHHSKERSNSILAAIIFNIRAQSHGARPNTPPPPVYSLRLEIVDIHKVL